MTPRRWLAVVAVTTWLDRRFASLVTFRLWVWSLESAVAATDWEAAP